MVYINYINNYNTFIEWLLYIYKRKEIMGCKKRRNDSRIIMEEEEERRKNIRIN
jgi:hypothetical protein